MAIVTLTIWAFEKGLSEEKTRWAKSMHQVCVYHDCNLDMYEEYVIYQVALEFMKTAVTWW